MMKNKGLILSIAIFTVVLACSFMSCNKDSKEADLQLKEGMIVYMAPPDNCNDFIIKVNDHIYKPSNLSSSFEIDSLNIRFAYETIESTYDCGFGGQIPYVLLTHIEKR